MSPIKLAIAYAQNLGLDCYPIGLYKGDHAELENAIAIIGFKRINEVFKTARCVDGAISLFKNIDSDLLECTGDIDQVLYFLSDKSENNLQLVRNGILHIVGVKVVGNSTF